MKKENYTYIMVIIACAGMAAAALGVCTNAYGVFLAPVSSSLGIMRGTFAIHSTCSTIAGAIIALFVPKFVSEKNFKFILLLGFLLASTSTMGMSFAKTMPSFIILGILRGMGSGMFGIVVCTMMINSWFIKNHGVITSCVLSCSGITGAILSPVFTSIIQNEGWQKAYLVSGMIILLFGLPSILFPISLKPETKGMTAYGEQEKKAVASVVSDSYSSFTRLSFPFILMVFFAIVCSGLTSLTQHLPGYAESVHFSASVGAMLLSCTMIGNISSKLIIGFLSDRIGVNRSVFCMLSIVLISLIILMIAPSQTILMMASFLFGFIYSVAAVGMVLLSKAIFGNANYNKTYPVLSLSGTIGSSILVSLFGYIYDYTGSYQSSLLLGAFLLVIGMIALGGALLSNKKEDAQPSEIKYQN